MLPTDVYNQVPSCKEEDQDPGKHEAALRCCWQHAGHTRGAQPWADHGDKLGRLWRSSSVLQKKQTCLKVCYMQSSAPQLPCATPVPASSPCFTYKHNHGWSWKEECFFFPCGDDFRSKILRFECFILAADTRSMWWPTPAAPFPIQPDLVSFH